MKVPLERHGFIVVQARGGVDLKVGRPALKSRRTALGRIESRTKGFQEPVLFTRPCHPHTIGLLAPVPRLERPRCGFAIARCAASFPPLEAVGQGHRAACFRTRELHNEL